jgi:hypothetical protein
MSNASYLLALDADSPVADVSGASCLRTGWDMVPPFWLACFRVSDLTAVSVPVQRSSGERSTIRLEMLWAPKPRALASLHAFHLAIRSCARIRAEVDPCIDVLTHAIERSAHSTLQLHDVEIQLMLGPEDNRPWMIECLTFLGEIAAGTLAADAILTDPRALELFDQAKVLLPDWTCELDWEEALIGMPCG